MAITRPQIIYPKGAVQKLAKHFGCNETLVRKAFHFEVNSELADAIRKDAVKNYGAVLKKIPVMIK